MKSKVFIPSEERFYIIDRIEKCDKCGKSALIYDGCQCYTNDTFRVLLSDKAQTYCDTLITTLAHVDEKDIYLQGLCTGQITAYKKIIELMKELEK